MTSWTNLTTRAATATVLYVAPTGKNNWSGKFAAPTGKGDGPFASVARARDAIRALKAGGQWQGPIKVLVRGGEYFLGEPLVFTPEDSGSSQWPITYARYPGDSSPVLNAGRRISGWRRLIGPFGGLPIAAGSNLWEADITAGWQPRELSVNAGPMPIAALPASPHWEQWYRTAAATTEELKVAPGLFALVPNLNDVDLNVRTGLPTNLVIPIAGLGPGARTIRLSRRVLRPNQTYFFRLENTPGGMLQPGNWWVDSARGKIYLWPPGGLDPNTALVVGARLLNALELKGDEEGGRLVRFLNLDGLSIADVSRNRVSPPFPPGRKYGSLDPNNTTDSAVLVHGAADCTFAHCRISGVAATGIRLWLYARRLKLLNNQINHCGGNGISIVGYNPGTRHETGGTVLAGNTIQYCGQTYWHSAGIQLAMAGDMTVRANHIAFMPYAGIMAGGQVAAFFKVLKGNNDYFRWDEIGETPLTINNIARFVPGNLTVENNIIHDTMMTAQDGGAIYLWGENNCTIRRNLVYRTLQDASFGIYLDRDTLDSVVTDNLVYQSPLPSPATYGAAFMMNTGGRNAITNNIFALTNRLFIINGDRGGNTIARNIFLFGPAISPVRRPLPATDELVAGPSMMDDNLYWSMAGPGPLTGWLAGWRRQGWDQHSIAADPLFADAAQSNFTLRPGSPAIRIGFKPFFATPD